ncbi:hypothetical protein ABU16_1543 [Bacillus subtilis]|nr:hypothetical protein ABU16_1543 [Bacillus subtilis]
MKIKDFTTDHIRNLKKQAHKTSCGFCPRKIESMRETLFFEMPG